MIYLVALLAAAAAALAVVVAAQLAPNRSPAIARRLVELEQMGNTPFSVGERRRRQARRERWEALLQALGERVESRDSADDVRHRLVHAGYRKPNALPLFLGIRTALPLALAAAAFLVATAVGARGAALVAAASAAALGYIAPSFYLDSRVKKRQRQIQLALPDALDLLVVCVEAGLGLNQAILRVADEIEHISTAMSEELGLVNLQIRAGTPRDEALRDLGERSGVEDLRSLATMLIQTDRFGTSVAQALRVHSDTLRTKRRQRAEEAAAKTAIKMLFPLVIFIFPSLFIVILGPAAIQIFRTLILKDPGQ
jgi:tight adherence protein C